MFLVTKVIEHAVRMLETKKNNYNLTFMFGGKGALAFPC